MVKHAGGRPPKLTPAQRIEVYEALERYIEREEDPTIVGFVAWDETALEYKVTDDNIGTWEEFFGLRKLAIKKQEAYLIKNGTKNRINTTMAIFRLKQPQHGYKDKQEVDQHNTGEQNLNINIVNYSEADGD